MPNLCFNQLRVSGDPERLRAFVDLLCGEESPLDFEKVLPTPEDELLSDTWRDWRIQHWGCKWNADEVEMDMPDDGSVVYTFVTPWRQPENLFYVLATVFHDLNLVLVFAEPMADIAGIMKYDGKVLTGVSGTVEEMRVKDSFIEEAANEYCEV